MARFEELETCAELTPEHACEAAASPASMREFLMWAAQTARPDEGAPKILLAIARLGEESWVDGALYIDITGDDGVTKISIFADYGFGIRERLLPLARLSVPFDEFVRAVRLAPKLIAPFRGEQLGSSLVLTPPGRAQSGGLEAISIAASSMVDDVALDEPGLPEEMPSSVTVPNPGGAETAPPSTGNAVTKPPPSLPEQSGVHTHPTVRRMTAVRPEALRSGNDD